MQVKSGPNVTHCWFCGCRGGSRRLALDNTGWRNLKITAGVGSPHFSVLQVAGREHPTLSRQALCPCQTPSSPTWDFKKRVHMGSEFYAFPLSVL
ncbi:hypothetical protein VTN96DRAFT_4030 [Rasamsonia emersonii]